MMNLEQILRRFWPFLLLILVWVFTNFQRKARIRDRRRSSLAKARRAKAKGDNPGHTSSQARSRPISSGNPTKRKNLSKSEFKALMAKGKRDAAKRRARA